MAKEILQNSRFAVLLNSLWLEAIFFCLPACQIRKNTDPDDVQIRMGT
jgi:hypothetical protein